MWHIYILRSSKDHQLYIGSTNDLERRLDEHYSGKVPATRTRLPFVLEGDIALRTENKARALE
ncbi:MAG: GIY-YIG nuclease family protein [Verrucomicrobia bacterium]|nr:GIY-YIG nuclease family protein [Verrucomicrobiota bacterium]MBU4247385.1 GIY-YIG nuclease family protein [Verrucomicrobiota bacterium]MBU4290634.1 GIY-YIG nuclease family protein [Verrucomicrobiota bacterium]MBU4429205.1 GIY-YIG nuclease family protein [Verrucomicrobiota bacterium]MBU4498467.1 GIY-YIG nuclease family protein [Verrucomicrobiota bacterium]